MKTEVNFHFALLTQLPSNIIQLVIVDTTAAVNKISILAHCVAL